MTALHSAQPGLLTQGLPTGLLWNFGHWDLQKQMFQETCFLCLKEGQGPAVRAGENQE